jgi:alkylation response protein AidB-like acyl-CoA dehydrogenase
VENAAQADPDRIEVGDMVDQATMTDTRKTALEAALALAPELDARSDEGTALRTMPADIAARAKRAGLFRLALPRSLGGLELDPASIITIIEALSAADGSAGWTILIGNSTAFFAWLDPDVAKEMIGGDPDFASSSMFGPMGHARPNGRDGVYSVSGRWPLNSGCPHAEWIQVGVFVMDENAPRMRPDGNVDWRFAFLPRDDVVIEDTWRPLGLSGTGSHHVSVSGAPVPEEHMPSPPYDPARHDGPLYRLPLFPLAAIVMAGFPLGVARRALDEFTTQARSKFRGSPNNAVAQDGFAQVQLARAEAGVQSARSYVFDVVGELWETCCRGDVPSREDRARLMLAVGNAMRAGVAAVDAVMPLAGASAVFDDQRLQRCFRDLHAANQHIIFSSDRDRGYGQLRLGLEPTLLL